MTKIIIADDHKIFRQGLKSIIISEKFGDVIAVAATGKELLALLPANTPDVILMDIDMPEMDGIEATHLALKDYPDLKILCLTSHGDEVHYYTAIDAGAKGFVAKSANIDELKLAINEVALGGNYISNELLRTMLAKINKELSKVHDASKASLTDQEVEVLLKICKGLSIDEIAEDLNMSVEVVKSCKDHLLAKTNSRNSSGLIMYAIKNEIIVVN